MSGRPDANGAAQLAYLYGVLDENERLTRYLEVERTKLNQRAAQLEQVRIDTQKAIDKEMERMDVASPGNAGYQSRLRSLIRMLATHDRPRGPIDNTKTD
jgi:hypothetical protein